MTALYRRLTAEFFGTFALVFFGCAVVVMDSFPGARWGVQGVALVHAIILAVAVSATMGISGGHLNPAVTAGLAAIRRITPVDAAAYIGAQLAGAVVAVAALKLVIPASVARLVSWGTPGLASQMTFTTGAILEAILTFMLMSAVMGTAVLRSAPKIGGFGIGLTLIPAIMIGGPLTGAALNPARAFGPALVSGTWTAQAVYWIGPIVGAVIAALLWQKVLASEEDAVG